MRTTQNLAQHKRFRFRTIRGGMFQNLQKVECVLSLDRKGGEVAKYAKEE